MNGFDDSPNHGWNGNGVRPYLERDAETSAARLGGGRSRSSAWGVGGSGPGAGARATAGAESDCARPLPGNPCRTAPEAISDVGHGEGSACCARACRRQREHPRETRSGGRCGGDGTREYEDGAASVGETRPFPHPEGNCTLLRQVDDFLLVTTSKEKAMAFVSAMHDKAKTGEWGFSVHEAKVSLVCWFSSFCLRAVGCAFARETRDAWPHTALSQGLIVPAMDARTLVTGSAHSTGWILSEFNAH